MKKWFALAALAAAAVGAHAQSFPGAKPINIVVPFAAGGPTDKVARDLAISMAKTMPGANFVVENVAGAGATKRAQHGKNADEFLVCDHG